MLVKGDLIVLTKEYGKLSTVGEKYEIGDITNNSIIVRDVKTKIALCSIGIDEFDNCFKKMCDVKGWTPWTEITGTEYYCVYRTNQKRVQVRLMNGDTLIRSEASCLSDDDFNLFVGIQIAYYRALKKILFSNMEKETRKLNRIESCIYALSNLR